MKHLEEKIDKHHSSEWHKWAGLGSTLSIVLPILSEFEAVGEEVFLAIGGTSAVSVFAMLMKFGRLTGLAGDIAEEHKEHLKEEYENNTDLHFSTSKTGIPYIGLCGSVFATGLVTSFAPITNATSVLAKSLLISSNSKTSS